MYGLSPEDLAIQATARAFVDELIPVRGRGRAEPRRAARRTLVAGHAKRANENSGWPRPTSRASSVAGAAPSLQQVLVQEQGGRVTNALAWVLGTPPSWLPAVATPAQIDRWLKPSLNGDTRECYAITEEGAGSDVDAIAATARRDGDDYVLNGVKWHVTSYNDSQYCFFQAKLDGRAARRRARDVRRRPADARRPRGAHARLHAHHRPPPPDRRVRRRAGARPTT